MGLAIDRADFTPQDHARFAAKLRDGLRALRVLLATPGFGHGPATVGAELELSLVDACGRPSPVNLPVLRDSLDERLTCELDRFNVECNLRYGSLAGRPFHALADEMQDALAEVARAARPHGARVAVIGTLPTLRAADLEAGAMTDTPRFRALSRALQERRRAPFRLCIDGAEPLDTHCDDVTAEGANTSLQVHLRVAPDRFAALYDAAQIATVAAVAASGNSPIFLGHRLWQETRVALFKQAVDARDADARRSGDPARVSFGSGWLRDGAYELFAEAVERFEALLPVCSDEDPLALLASGEVPQLGEIRLHQGTVWRWNRPVYDPAGGGHLRIEMRALPAGPTVADMAANTAFLVGVTLGLAPAIDAWRRGWPFEALHRSFYRAAKHGLAAKLDWPLQPGARPCTRPAPDVVRALLPVAAHGLAQAGVDADERHRLLGIVAERVASGTTGAVWQERTLESLEARSGREGALSEMLLRYMQLSHAGEPVHRWPLDV